MFTPDSVNSFFTGKLVASWFFAAVGCTAMLVASGCGEVTTTPVQVSAVEKSDAPPPEVVEEPAEQPGDPDTGGYDSNFLWKPVSDSDGNLVVLTPYQLNFRSVSVGKETSTSLGTSNGHRQTFRFSLPGARYGKKVTVTGRAVKGQDKVWIVPDGAVKWSSK